MKPQIENLGKVSITVEKDPYDASKAYPKLTIVYIEGDYRTYISRKPVLPNTSILDKEFWIPFSSLSEQLLINYNGFKELVLQELGTQNVTIRRIDNTLNQFINTDITNLIEEALAGLAVVIDDNYVHTDNNYTSAEKTKLGALPTNSELNTLLENITNRFADYYTKLQTYNRTEIDSKVQAVRDALDTLIGTNNVTTAIDTFNEIVTFLADYENNGDLKDIIDTLESAVKTWANNKFVEQANLYNNIYNKTEVYTKSEIDGKVQTINNTFGSYLLSTEAASTYLSKTDAASQYQPKGSYLVAADIEGKANKSELTITPGTGNNSDKTTIQLKNNVSATVLTEHQDISGKANTSDLHTVATSGSYTDLNDKPQLFSGDYNDLTNKPVIPEGYGDDAARANWGGDWRIPTIAEFQALGAAVNTAWTQVNNVYGILCTDKTDSSKTLFFPAAGYCDGSSVYSVGDVGDYWSSSLNSNGVVSAWNLDFNDEDTDWDNGSGRCCGYAVRGVLDDSNVNANGHEYVEIGGLKWATMNIGANNVTDYGLYFQWGDTQGYTAFQVGSGDNQKYFGWADYKYGNGTSSPVATDMTKYNATDGKVVLDLSTPVEYLHKVAITGDYNDLNNKLTIPSIEPLAKQTYLTYITIYPEDCYFTYIALGDGTCHLANSDYYYSKDLGATWNHITSSSEEINVVKRDVVLFKGTIMPQAYAGIGQFKSSVAYEIAGNPMSFIYGDNFRGKIDWPSNMPDGGGFYAMFSSETNLRNAKHLILTASSVQYMAYNGMFTNCSNLVAGPIIAAETLLNNSCKEMFYNCAKLSYINTRFLTTSSNNPLSYWVHNVASKGIFIKNVNATWTYTGDSGVPDGWTVYYDYQH